MTRQWGLIFAALVGAVLDGIILTISSPLFSRYLLFGIFPAFLLAGYAVDRAGWLAAMLVARVARSGRTMIWSALAARVVVGVLGVVFALSERSQLAAEVVLNPAQAALPQSEHFRYVDQWFAAYGLGQIVDELRARSAAGPITLVVAPASRENRVMLPHNALQFYLRGDSNIRIVQAPALFRAQDLRDLRRQTREGPTYLVINGSHTDAPGMPNEIPDYTRQLERRLRQDVPDSREVLRIPRPEAPNWLSLYRLDAGDWRLLALPRAPAEARSFGLLPCTAHTSRGANCMLRVVSLGAPRTDENADSARFAGHLEFGFAKDLTTIAGGSPSTPLASSLRSG